MDTKSIKRQLLGKIRIGLLQKTDTELLLSLLSMEKNGLNNQVPDGAFPAWDIARRLYENNWEVSPKQRKGLINTASYFYADFVFNQALENVKRR